MDEKKLILKLELYFPVYWEDYVMAKMVDDYSILIQLIFLGENKFLVELRMEWKVCVSSNKYT